MQIRNIKNFFLVGALIASLLNFLTTPAQAASTVTLKNLYITVTYPSTVKMPKGDCGKFKVTYKLGLRATAEGFGFATITLFNDLDPAGGKYLSYNLSLQPESESGKSGSFDLKFCKEDWTDPKGNERIGISAGTHVVSVYSNFGDEVEKSGKIKLLK